MNTLATAAPLLLLVLTACGPDKEADTGLANTGPSDTDTAAEDTATEDTGTNDTGADDTDSGTDDTGTTDTDTGADDSGDSGGGDTASPYANCGEEGNGSAGDSWNSTYDANGRRTTYNFNNPSASGATLYTWDAAGNMLETSTDNSFDGSIDVRTRYTYDERNNPVTYEFFRFEALEPTEHLTEGHSPG